MRAGGGWLVTMGGGEGIGGRNEKGFFENKWLSNAGCLFTRAYSENKRTTVVFVDFESNFIQSIWNKVQNLWVSEDQAVELTGEWED